MNKAVLVQKDNLLAFSALASHPIFHGVFNRRGGCSPAPWDSLNVSLGLGDNYENVMVNRRRIRKILRCAQLVSARQVHGRQVYVVVEKPESDLEVNGYDAMITNIAGIGLMVQQADCQAVLLFDPVKRSVGIVHSGWRGSVANIISRTVSAMRNHFATAAADLVAAVSPSLGPCCAEFKNYRKELPGSFHSHQVRPEYFDFWAISHNQLRMAGVMPENIHIAGICTCCNHDFFSYRRDRNTGRFASVIGLHPD